MRGGEGGLLIRKVEEEEKEVDKVEVKISLSPCHKLHMVDIFESFKYYNTGVY